MTLDTTDVLEVGQTQTFAHAAKTIQVDTEKRTMVATITTEVVAHNGAVIVVDGVDLTVYRSNPVVLWSHQHFLPPVGRNLWIKRDGGALIAKSQFATRPENHSGEWIPDTLLNLYAQDILRGVSVGLKINKLEFMDEEGRKRDDVRKNKILKAADFIIWESVLLEYSCCSIPMNPATLRHAQEKELVAMSVDMQRVLGLGPGKAIEINTNQRATKQLSANEDSKGDDEEKNKEEEKEVQSVEPVAAGNVAASDNEEITDRSSRTSNINSVDNNNASKTGVETALSVTAPLAYDDGERHHVHAKQVITKQDVDTALESLGGADGIAKKVMQQVDIGRAVRSAVNKVRGKV